MRQLKLQTVKLDECIMFCKSLMHMSPMGDYLAAFTVDVVDGLLMQQVCLGVWYLAVGSWSVLLHVLGNSFGNSSDVVRGSPSKLVKTQKPDLYQKKNNNNNPFWYLSSSSLHHIESHSWTSQFSNQSKFTFFKRLHSKKSICLSRTTEFVIQGLPKAPWTKIQ